MKHLNENKKLLNIEMKQVHRIQPLSNIQENMVPYHNADSMDKDK